MALKQEDDDLPPAGFRDVVNAAESDCAVYRSPPPSSDALPTLVHPVSVQVDTNNNTAFDVCGMNMAEARAKQTSLSSGQGEKSI